MIELKFNQYIIYKVNRARRSNAVTIKNIGGEELVKKLAIEALPFGEPETEVIKVVAINDTLYIATLIMDGDNGFALVLRLPEEYYQHNTLSIGETALKKLKELKNTKEYPKEIKLNIIKGKLAFTKIEHMAQLVFSLITKQPTIFLGDKRDIRAILYTFIECVPSELRMYLTFALPSASFNENVTIVALPPTDRNLKLLAENKGKFTVLFLPTKTAFGRYTSPLCEHISELFARGEAQEIQSLLKKYYDLAVSSDTLETPADFAEKNNLHIADSILVQWMRANYFNLELDLGFLEHLLEGN